MTDSQNSMTTKDEKLLETLIEVSLEGVLIIENGLIVQCNETIVQMLHYNSRDELRNTHHSKLSPEFQPDGHSSYEKSEEMIRIAIEDDGHQFEWVYNSADDEALWVEVTLTPIFLNHRNVIHAVWKDISQIKSMDAALKASEALNQELKERVELAISGNNDGIWDWNIIDDSVYFSPRWKEMLGFNDDEISNDFSNWETRVHPDELPDVLIHVQDNLEGKTEYFETTYRLKHKDGHWVWILDRGKTLFDESGKAVRMIGTHTDVTTEKEKQLEFAHQVQTIAEVHDSVISTDLEGYITNWNTGSEVLLEYTADEMVGEHIKKIYLEEDYDSLHKNINALKQKRKHNAIVRLVKKTRSILVAELSLSLLKDERGAPVGMIGYSRDITERQQAEDELLEQHKYMQSIIDSVDDPIMVIKEDYTVSLMNSMLHQQTINTNVTDPEHPKCYEISHQRSTPCDGHNHPCPLQIVMESEEHISVVHDHINVNGKKKYVELSAAPLFDNRQNCIGIIEVARDITEHLVIQDELREQKNILHHQAHHDALTGLPNRVLFNDRLQHGIEKAKRNKTELALFFIDLDRFKQINDSLGHATGDSILKIVTERLKNTIRNEDTLARLGGDEFTIIMEDLNQRQDASLLAHKILEILELPMQINDQILYVSSSIGISLYPQDDMDAHTLLKYADTAMYRAKEEGRNNCQFYSAEMTELAVERIVMKTSLRQALEKEEFVVHYQPQIDANTNTLTGVEALIRWQHPTQGLIWPAKFLSLAEETGLIVEINLWVMRTAMRQVGIWYQQGLNPGVLALNLTMRQLRHDDFVQTIQQMIETCKFKPQWLELEVTEGRVMQKPESSIKKLKQVNALGIGIAIDDFGTGYSSLSSLKRLPINKLKIDRSFVKDVPENEEDTAIVKAIIALAKSLNLDLIAEGVETLEQKDFLVENNCTNIQGFYYSRPLPADEIETMLKSP